MSITFFPHHGCFVKQLENPSLENVLFNYCVVFHAELLPPGGMTAQDAEARVLLPARPSSSHVCCSLIDCSSVLWSRCEDEVDFHWRTELNLPLGLILCSEPNMDRAQDQGSRRTNPPS